jgi:2-keto-4-pentenoate hydratase
MIAPGLARRQLDDYDARRPGMLFAGPCQLSVEQAYEIQFEVAALRRARGERLAGYKVGCLSAPMQAQFGLAEPVFGHVWESELHPSGAVLDAAAYANPAVEGEFAVRLAAGIPSEAGRENRPVEIAAAAFAVIELHHYLFRRLPPTAPELIANNALHAGVVLPAQEPPLPPSDRLLDRPVAVRRNGKQLGASTTRAIPGGPLSSVARLAAHLARYGVHLQEGQLVLTGSPLPLYPVAAGDRIEVFSDGRPPVSLVWK